MSAPAPVPRTARTLTVFAAGLALVFGAAFGVGRLVPPVDGAVTPPPATSTPSPTSDGPHADGPHTG